MDNTFRFLDLVGWSAAVVSPMVGDASTRMYKRLELAGNTAILLSSPDENIRPFLHIGSFLLRNKFSAPTIFAFSENWGLVLLEDLGDYTFGKFILDKGNQQEHVLYAAAIDLLIDLANQKAPQGLQVMNISYLLSEIGLFTKWWRPKGVGENVLSEHENTWKAAWASAYEYALSIPYGLALKDFHADNLMWLPDRLNLKRVGLLDFQDAMIAPVSYDLVSLLQDARRDVSCSLESTMVDRFSDAFPQVDKNQIRQSYYILGAHRNFRILGVFSRLVERDRKEQYAKFMPRVWNHIEKYIDQPALAPVRKWLDRHVPNEDRGLR